MTAWAVNAGAGLGIDATCRVKDGAASARRAAVCTRRDPTRERELNMAARNVGVSLVMGLIRECVKVTVIYIFVEVKFRQDNESVLKDMWQDLNLRN